MNFANGTGRLLTTLVLLLLGVAPVDAANEIRRNPFSRPPPAALAVAEPTAPLRQDEEWQPELRAVLVAGANSVADLGGVILRLGESTNGYRLVSVKEGNATFYLKDERIVISLYEQQPRDQ